MPAGTSQPCQGQFSTPGHCWRSQLILQASLITISHLPWPFGTWNGLSPLYPSTSGAKSLPPGWGALLWDVPTRTDR